MNLNYVNKVPSATSRLSVKMKEEMPLRKTACSSVKGAQKASENFLTNIRDALTAYSVSDNKPTMLDKIIVNHFISRIYAVFSWILCIFAFSRHRTFKFLSEMLFCLEPSCNS